MDPPSKLLERLAAVLPYFADAAKSIITRHPKATKAWIAWTRFQACLEVLFHQLESLRPQFGRRQWTPIQGECSRLLHEVMGTFERLLVSGQPQPDGNRKIAAAYPLLDRLRLHGNPADEIAQLSQFQNASLHDLVPQLDQWTDALGSLLPETSIDRKCPPYGIRKLSEKFHNVLSQYSHCICPSSHDTLLFMASHRGIGDLGGYAAFDVMFQATTQSDWREGQVCVTFESSRKPDGDSAQHDVPFTRTVPIPRRQSVVDSICNSIKDTEEAFPRARLNMLIENHKMWHTRPTARQFENIATANAVSLHELLVDGKEFSILTGECRTYLSTLIANSFLHLRRSAWLPIHWNKVNILFLESEDELLLRPYVMAKTCQKGKQVVTQNTHQDPERISLGVLLLELFLQEPIENMIDPEQDLVPGSGSNIAFDTFYFASSRVLDELMSSTDGAKHGNYFASVDACLKPNVSTCDKESEEYTQFLYDQIVQPLEQELYENYGVKPEKLDEKLYSIKGAKSAMQKSHTTLRKRSNSEDAATRTERVPAHDNTRNARLKLSITESSLPFSPSSGGTGSGQIDSSHHSGTRCADVHGAPVRSRIPQVMQSSFASSRSHAHQNETGSFSLYDDQTLPDEAEGHADSWFSSFKEQVLPHFPIRPNMKRVKIAVLDTGIDMRNPFITLHRGRIIQKSFLDEDPTITDVHGHGTHVAGLLLKVATNSQLYVGRVTQHNDVVNEKCIANAIRYAVEEWNVDIISMSFGFSGRTEAVECIHTAIIEAYKAGILMFAAARNDGGNDDIAYPANQNEVICVSSTDGQGNASKFNPTPVLGRNFSTLGEGVMSSWIAGEMRRKSGTSFATPIAAGIGALVIEYVRHKLPEQLEEKVKRPQGMGSVLDLMAKTRQEFKYIVPWRLFGGCHDGLSISSRLIDALKKV